MPICSYSDNVLYFTDARLEEFVYDKLGQLDSTVKKPKERETNHEILGLSMVEAGSDIGPGTAYGKMKTNQKSFVN